MTGKRDPASHQAVPPAVIFSAPPPRSRRYRARLDTLRDVRRELARVYRELRAGTLDPMIAAKAVYALAALRQTIFDGEVEARVEQLSEGKEDGPTS